uniref:Uncharacterized protein n=1 Tax=Nymphaea colorata TaxID=210225 RepID=A0A5K1DUT8_9MAGN
MASHGSHLASLGKESVYLLPICLSSSGQPSSRPGCFDTRTTKGGVHEGTFSQVSSSTADRLFRLATPLLATLLFAYTTYLSMEMEGDPLTVSFSLALYCVFLLSTASILYAHSLRNEGSQEKRKKGLYIVISLFCVIGLAFFTRVYVILPRPAYCLLMLPWLLPISAILAFYFIRLRILSSARVVATAAY